MSEYSERTRDTFLRMVAHDLYRKLGGDLSRTAIVFPNKRANLFFNEYLADQSERPIWSPAAGSISELFGRLSPLKPGDPIRLVCELYKVFVEETHSEETLDEFYFWGELLIADFDDADKNLVDADKLFGNLRDLKNLLDDNDFLEPEQKAAIGQFFANFSIEKHTELKRRFISLWDKLGDIYRRYRANLRALGIAYEGMLYRDAMENLDTGRLEYERYVFAGFNVLNRVETALFARLRDAGKAMFYWDYDLYYTERVQGHEAGEFIRRDLRLFPNELPPERFDAMRRPKTVRYVAATTENAQARFIPQWARDTFDAGAPEKENAVVLCNESLLLPALRSIPETVSHINVTMGFPLGDTPIYSFVVAALELQTKGYQRQTGRYTYEATLGVLRHPYTRQLSPQAETLERELTENNRFYPLPSELKRDPFLELLFTPHTAAAELCGYLTALIQEIATIYRHEAEYRDLFDQLYRESLFQSYTRLNRLDGLIAGGGLSVRPETLKRLVGKVLAATNIPFHGEPAIGMQIMGVLETRNLDFRNLLLLSVNEGQLPKAGGDSSFIPYNLRKAFGMTTIEHKNAVYAYYFYRLIQRAENVTLLYNTSSDGLNRGEPSRFMTQLLVEGPHEVTHEYLEAAQSTTDTHPQPAEKSAEALDTLRQAYAVDSPRAGILSPSALNCYLDCQLKFYYRYVKGLRELDEVSAEIDSALFGTIFHRSAELTYSELTRHGKEIAKEDLERALHQEGKLQGHVDRAFREILFKTRADEKPEYNGLQLINAKVILSYLKQLLRADLRYAPFSMVAMEERVSRDITIDTRQGPLTLRLGGTVDRMDAKDGTLRVVDYKTGGTPRVPTGVAQLFEPSGHRPGYVFQTFLYASIVGKRQPLRVAPALLYIHHAASDTYSPVIAMGEAYRPKVPVTDFGELEEDFDAHLRALLEEIFDEGQPFTPTDDEKQCAYCPFAKGLCR
ncbi:MAG: PD-(D/E)XK nuclease family protein [Mediterranea sp.]|jgi:hypothetical protein|nr:PD-(D/E)XK nuclease family protein [Mediterranea sp.]